MIDGRNIFFRVGDRDLLQDVTVTVTPGRLTVLVGPNGAGKSTLLKVLAHEVAPSKGLVQLNGKALNDYSRIQLARQRAILPQKSSLSFPFSVQEVVEMGRLPLRTLSTRKNDANIVSMAMDYAHVSHLKESIYTSLSGGEQQRVHLARVLSQIWDSVDDSASHRYLLLDEPTSALDLEHQHHILQIVRNFARERHIGVLIVLHDLNLAAMYADEIVVMRSGKIVETASPYDVLTEDRIREVFSVDAGVIDNPFVQCPLVICKQKSEIGTESVL